MPRRLPLRLPGTAPHVRRIYDQAWQAYRTAGCPFGEDDAAMYIWFLFAQDTRVN